MSRQRQPLPRWLLGWMALGLALRAGVTLALDPDMLPRGDEGPYLLQSAALFRGGELDTGSFVRPPLYFGFLAVLAWPAQALGIPPRLLVKLVQCALGAALAIPVWRTARRIAGPRAARLAVGFAMLDPTLIAYCHLIWPETLFALLVAIVFDGVAGLEARSRLHQVGLGLVTGLTLLLKPVFGLFTLLLAGDWLCRLGWRRAAGLALVFGGSAALVVAPWVVRNQLRYGPEILLENQGPYNLWIGNDPAPPRAILEEWRALPDPLTRSRVARQRGLAAIAADPAGFAARGAVRMLNLWGLEWFVVRHAVIGGYGPIGRDALLGLFWILQLGWALVWLATAAGLPTVARDPAFRLLLVWAGVFTLLVFGLVATTRFRVPFALPLAVAAGAGVDRALRGGLGRREWLAVAVALAVLGLSATRPIFRTIAVGDWSRVEQLENDDWRFFRY
jgi:hypothetical protein